MNQSPLEHYSTQARIAELEAEVERLKPDAKRLDWLEQLAHASGYSTQIRLLRDPAINAGMNRIEVRTGCGSGPWERPYEAASLRAAIDAALAASKGA